MSSTLAAHKHASRTAYDCAAVRAAVYAWTRCPSSDYLASHYVHGPSASARARVGVALAKLGASRLTKFMMARTSPGIEVFLFARQAVPDGMIRAALQEDAETQVVILGAGLDTSGLRINDERLRAGQAPGLFFEVDLPATQLEKRNRSEFVASKLATSVSGTIRYVACSFGQDELSSSLLEAGFSTSKPTIWVWSGVIHYLTEAAIHSTVGELKRLSKPGSRLFFDLILLEAFDSPGEYGFSTTKARFDAFGEVMSFGFRKDPSHVSEWLAAQELELEKVYTNLDMVHLFEAQTGMSAPSQGTPWSHLCIASF